MGFYNVVIPLGKGAGTEHLKFQSHLTDQVF